MPTYPLVRFMDSPSTSGTVLYDLQTAPAKVLADGFDIGVPTLSGSPDGIGRQWGYRRLTLRQVINGNKATAVPFVAALAKQLLKRRNWLMLQTSALAKPVWFRTFATEPGAITFDTVYNTDTAKDRWEVTVQVDAEPFMYGAAVSLGSVVIGNDPSTGTNPCSYTLPAIVGDAAAPLRIRVTGDQRGNTALLSVIGSSTSSTGSIIAVPTATLGADTTTSTNSTFVGGDFHTVTFTTDPSLVVRVNYSGPTVVHGTYKALLRAKSSSSTITSQLQLRYVNTTTLTDTTVTVTNNFQYFDLGTFDWPPTGVIDDDFLGSQSSTFGMSLFASRTSGTTNLWVDALVLIPVEVDDDEADTLIVTYPTSSVSPNGAYIDSWSKSVRHVTSSDTARPGTLPAALKGQFPFVVPGETNVLRFFQTIAPSDVVTATATLAMSYQPQWLYQADT
jgi:hypothetical protein